MDDEVKQGEYELHERIKEQQSKPQNEKAILLDKGHKVSPKTAVKLRFAAICISWVSLIVSFFLGVSAIVFAALYGNQSLLSFGLDSMLDCISSIIIFWRFYSRDTIYSGNRELRACIMIGTLFLLSSFLIVTKCIFALLRSELPRRPSITLILSSVNAFCCLLLASIKVYIGVQLESRALITDSIITYIGAVMSLFTLIFSAVYEYNRRLWYLDDSFGILCSIFLFGYGLWIIVVSKLQLKRRADS